MTITDTFLEEITKSINNESYVFPAYLAVASTQVTAIETNATVLSGEFGDRDLLTGSRVTNVVNLSAINSGATITNPDGTNIGSSGLMSVITSGVLLTGVTHSGITQTTNFDIKFEYKITTNRQT
ncbi:unnamed protein product [marine sediment metagenome]|uniref:Uncharacterized protein n=1 Tax=marine sediment metagenome TaxID=412755 RepID=X0SKU5_9ZZZZ